MVPRRFLVVSSGIGLDLVPLGSTMAEYGFFFYLV